MIKKKSFNFVNMKFFNWIPGTKKPNQYNLGKSNNMIGTYFGLGFPIDEFNLYSQVKDYRTDLLNGTNWRPFDIVNAGNFSYLQFIRMLNKYSTSIFNDYLKVGFAVFAKIEGQIFYISPNNYTKNENKVSVHGFSNVETFVFDEPNAFSGEKTIYQKCLPYQELYNIALSCQKNGMYKSGFVTVISPKSPAGMPVSKTLTDGEILAMEKRLSEGHGVATGDQNNFLIVNQEIDLKTIMFDSSKLGILDAKKLCEEYVCSKLGVPFVLLPSEGQTFANYKEANDILYENHSKYCEYFCKFAKDSMGFDIDYKTIAESGKGIV